MSPTLPARATCRSYRRGGALAVTLLLVAACGSSHDSAPTIPPTVSVTAGSSTSTVGSVTTSSTVPGSSTSTGSSASTTTGPTSSDPSTVTTTFDTTHQFDFKAPVTHGEDLPILDVYRNFMAVEEQAELNPTDAGLQAQLAAVTTSREYNALQAAFSEFLAKGETYRVVEPTTYHPFLEYGDVYRDGFRRVSDCFIGASAHVDSAGTAVAGETLERQTYGFVVEFELHDGKWLASASYFDSGVCLAGQ